MSGIAAGAVIGGKVDFQRFTDTSGDATWNKPAGVTKIYMELIGGGGGAGGGNIGSGGNGGGGGGALARGTYNAESLPSSLTVTVGAGGAAGPAQYHGHAGASSTVIGSGFTLSAGGGGLTQSASNGAGGGGGGTAFPPSPVVEPPPPPLPPALSP